MRREVVEESYALGKETLDSRLTNVSGCQGNRLYAVAITVGRVTSVF